MDQFDWITLVFRQKFNERIHTRKLGFKRRRSCLEPSQHELHLIIQHCFYIEWKSFMSQRLKYLRIQLYGLYMGFVANYCIRNLSRLIYSNIPLVTSRISNAPDREKSKRWLERLCINREQYIDRKSELVPVRPDSHQARRLSVEQTSNGGSECREHGSGLNGAIWLVSWSAARDIDWLDTTHAHTCTFKGISVMSMSHA